jgi:hypothetical protein
VRAGFGEDGLPDWAGAALDLLAWAAGGGLPRGGRPAAVVEELRRRSLDGLHYLALDPGHPRQRLYDAVWRAQRAAIADMLHALEAAGITAVVFKGAEIAERWLASRPIGIFADCDLLVPRDEVVEAMAVLFGEGFRPRCFDPEAGGLVPFDLAAIGAILSQHYEIPPFWRSGSLDLDPGAAAAVGPEDAESVRVEDGMGRLAVAFDVHHRFAVDLDAAIFLDRRVPGPFSAGFSPTPADHLWCLLVRYYNEVALNGKSTLRDLAYAALLVGRAEIDWDRVVALSVEHDTRPGPFYLLSWLDGLVPGCVPGAVLRELDPRRGSRARDFGWLAGRLLGAVEPNPFGRR